MPKIYISFDDNTDYTLSPSERNWVAAQLQLACDTAELETGVLLAAGVESPGTPIKMQGTMYSWIDHTNIADQDEMISPAELYARIAERAGVMLNDQDEIYGYTVGMRCWMDEPQLEERPGLQSDRQHAIENPHLYSESHYLSIVNG